jgi:hypothetical protein
VYTDGVCGVQGWGLLPSRVVSSYSSVLFHQLVNPLPPGHCIALTSGPARFGIFAHLAIPLRHTRLFHCLFVCETCIHGRPLIIQIVRWLISLSLFLLVVFRCELTLSSPSSSSPLLPPLSSPLFESDQVHPRRREQRPYSKAGGQTGEVREADGQGSGQLCPDLRGEFGRPTRH